MIMGRPRIGGILGGSVVAATAAYLFLNIGARILGADAFAPVASLWTLQFLVLAVVLVPLEQLAIRAVTVGGTPPYRPAAIVGAVALVVTTVYGYLDRATLFGGDLGFVALVAVAVLALSGFSFGRGLLAGEERYERYGMVTGAHAVIRLGLGAPLLAVTGSALAGGASIALAPLAVFPLMGATRRQQRRKNPSHQATPFLAGLIAGNGFAQFLLLGGPLVVGWLGGTPAQMSTLFVILTFFRAPVAVANNAVARLLPPFTRLARAQEWREVRAWAIRLALGGAVLSVVGALAARSLGPPVVAFLFGTEFAVDPAQAMWVAAGSILATAGALSNQVLVGLDRTALVAAAWGAGVVVATLVVAFANPPLVERVTLAFALGEAVAITGLWAGTHFATSKVAAHGS